MEVEEMTRDGYDRPFSCALTCATATVGPIFPPSIPLLMYAMMAQVSVGKLFMGGMIPAVLICVALCVYVWYISKKRNYPEGVHFKFKEFLIYTWKALPALLTPVILLGGMYTGIVTPTEAGAIAALYTIIISVLIYKSLSLKEFIRVIKDTCVQSGFIIVCIAGSFVLSHVISTTGIGDFICDWLIGITSNKYVFLIIINIAFLIIGMFFDTLVLMLVFMPLVIPVASAFGINLIHFGVLIIVNIMIGLSTPPYGGLCFTVSALTKVPLGKIFKEIAPMVCVMLVVLLLITYVPDIVMAIPNWIK
jgi:tripartite ATP-independent transporter DctM subunit